MLHYQQKNCPILFFRKVKKADEQLKVLQENLRQMEAVSVQNSEQEDNFEKEIHTLSENLKTVSIGDSCMPLNQTANVF